MHFLHRIAHLCGNFAKSPSPPALQGANRGQTGSDPGAVSLTLVCSTQSLHVPTIQYLPPLDAERTHSRICSAQLAQFSKEAELYIIKDTSMIRTSLPAQPPPHKRPSLLYQVTVSDWLVPWAGLRTMHVHPGQLPRGCLFLVKRQSALKNLKETVQTIPKYNAREILRCHWALKFKFNVSQL